MMRTSILTLFTAIPTFIIATRQGAAAFSAIALARGRNIPSINDPTENAKKGKRTPGCNFFAGRSSMLSSSPSYNGADGGDVIERRIRGRKNRVIRGYEAMLVSYVIQGLMIAREGAASILPIVGYIVPPAGISYIMISATRHDRLGSDTYKRMNLALFQYGVIGLLASALIGGMRISRILPLALAAVNSIKGYARGVLGWNMDKPDVTLLGDFTNGLKATATGLFSRPKNFKAFAYAAANLMVGSLCLIKVTEIVEVFLAKSLPPGEIATAVARYNRLAFLGLMLYTLRDAADRDRLGGTTFIQMNYLCALSMAAHGQYFAGGIATPVGALCAILGVLFAFNGISSDLNKR